MDAWKADHTIRALVDNAAKFPFRQLELDQRKGCVGPGAGIDQSTDPTLRRGTARCKPRAQLRDDLHHEFRRDRLGATKLCLQQTKVLLVYGIEQHDTSLPAVVKCATSQKDR